MANVLLCTQDSMLVRGLEYPLRDAGHDVTAATGTADGVRRFLERAFDVVVLDADSVGMSADEAVSVLRRVAPETRAVVRGEIAPGAGVGAVSRGRGLEELKRAILAAVPPHNPEKIGKERG